MTQENTISEIETENVVNRVDLESSKDTVFVGIRS
jgi:hypothetical protein